jgi:adenylate cyclase
MPVEIERKFLVDGQPWSGSTTYKDMVQGYLSIDPRSTVRIRVERSSGTDMITSLLTIKGLQVGISRPEYEYQIPVSDAEEMIRNNCQHRLSKRRWFVHDGMHEWHVDEFMEDNRGLVVAEIELLDQDELFEIPGWLGREITNDHRYSNANLSMNPWTFW